MRICSQICCGCGPGTVSPLLDHPSPTLPYLLVFIFPRTERGGQASSCWKQNGSRNLAEKSKNICHPTGNFIFPVFLNQVILLLTAPGNVSGGSEHKPKLIPDQSTGHVVHFYQHPYFSAIWLQRLTKISFRFQAFGLICKWGKYSGALFMTLLLHASCIIVL